MAQSLHYATKTTTGQICNSKWTNNLLLLVHSPPYHSKSKIEPSHYVKLHYLLQIFFGGFEYMYTFRHIEVNLLTDMKYSYGTSSPSSTWDRDLNNKHDTGGPKSLQPTSAVVPDVGSNGRRCRTPRSVPNSRPQSSTRSASSSRPRRSISQHPNRKCQTARS